jgi:hypothetical protein
MFISYISLPCQPQNLIYLNQSGEKNPNQFRNGEIFQINPKRLRTVMQGIDDTDNRGIFHYIK